jgi:plasmid stability protein
VTAPRHLSVRDIPAELARALKAEARRRHASVNQTAKDLLARALGLDPESRYDNGLGALAGTWSTADHAEFERATAGFETVDDELWR